MTMTPLSPTYGAITYEHWFSLDVGSDVKMIDGETFMGQETRELTSTSYVPPTYTLTLNAVNGTIGASPLPVGGVYEQGTVVTLTANADSGYHFTNWSGDATGTANPVTITMDADKTVTASFASDNSAFYFAEGTTRTNFQAVSYTHLTLPTNREV